jgi:hypothetical protein
VHTSDTELAQLHDMTTLANSHMYILSRQQHNKTRTIPCN